jgi:hypothetical protein
MIGFNNSMGYPLTNTWNLLRGDQNLLKETLHTYQVPSWHFRLFGGALGLPKASVPGYHLM